VGSGTSFGAAGSAETGSEGDIDWYKGGEGPDLAILKHCDVGVFEHVAVTGVVEDPHRVCAAPGVGVVEDRVGAPECSNITT
jgi:hypothetical protein